MVKWQVLKWSGEDIDTFLNIYRAFEALWDTCMKTINRNAKEHSINKVMQELTTAGIHSLLTMKNR